MQTWRQRAALGTMTASGFAGLGYQIVWTQQSALWLGHEAAAVLAVVTAFFGGLAPGALALGERIERSRRPERWYAACEFGIASWSLALAALMAPVSAALLGFIGAQPSPVWQWSVAFGGSFLLLLPATAAMGATLPAMERVVSRLGRQGGSIAALYASNTLGAVIGVLAAAFWLVPRFGLAHTASLCAVLNVLCAAVALTLSGARPTAMPSPGLLPTVTPAHRHTLALLAATGLLGIGYEVLVVRVISQVAENTVYTFAMVLAVYLVGTSIGAAAYQRRYAEAGMAETRADALRDRLLLALALVCLLGTASLWVAEWLRDGVRQQLGASVSSALMGEAAVAVAAFALQTVVMGALFSHLGTVARAAGIGFGRALGANTLGAAAAPLLFGVVVLPALGAKFALLGVAAGYLALSSRRAGFTPAGWATTAACVTAMALAPPLVFVEMPEGGRVVSYREGPMAAVSVVEDARGVSRLRIDNRQQEGSSATRFADARQAWLPLLLHPVPQRVLFLGLGTGVTASSAAEDPTLQVDAVELLPEVIAASSHFTRAFASDQPGARLHPIAADARRFIRTTPSRYDVIVADNFHPARSGSGSLYSVEHFRAVQAKLTPGGVFCQWLPLHQLDLQSLRSIVRAFVAVYPKGMAMLATHSLETPVLGLIARAGTGARGYGARFDLRALRERLSSQVLSQRVAKFGFTDEFAVLGSFVCGPSALVRFAGDAPVNTDDHPVVAYGAPRITYAPDSLPRDRLVALLHALSVEPADVIDVVPEAEPMGGADSAWPLRLAAYWAARNRFIEAGRGVRPSANVGVMLAQVREPLLSVLRISPEFRPAYDPLLRMAYALGRTDPAAARALLSELMQAQPARSEAAQAMQQLADSAR